MIICWSLIILILLQKFFYLIRSVFTFIIHRYITSLSSSRLCFRHISAASLFQSPGSSRLPCRCPRPWRLTMLLAPLVPLLFFLPVTLLGTLSRLQHLRLFAYPPQRADDLSVIPVGWNYPGNPRHLPDSQFRRPYCYFRLSVVVAIIWEHFLWTRHGREPQNCRWNFDDICHSSRDISISGLGGRIVISGCRSLSQSFGDTFFDVAVVEELDFVTWITTILILDLFCHISQHDHKNDKILSVSKNSHVFDVMPKNFRCTDWWPDCCILYPLHIQENSRKGSA